MGTGTGSIDLSTLNNLHTNLTQHFWFNSNTGVAYGTGVHITLSSQAEFIASPTGQNILMNTDGISIRNGTIPLMVLDNDSLDFNVVTDLAQGTYSNVATFGATGFRMGAIADGETRLIANGGGIDLIRRDGTSDSVLAHFGYDYGTPEQSEQPQVQNPYYTFGYRLPNYDVGNWSVAEGTQTVASGFASHAEGKHTVASGNYSHVEGYHTEASGVASHAEGFYTVASDHYSHAEGYYTEASSNYSHAEGYHTIAGLASHAEGYYTKASSYAHAEGYRTIAHNICHVEGQYNVEDDNSKYAHIIGNGNSDSDRSNALTVDWNGTIRTHKNSMKTLLSTASYMGGNQDLTFSEPVSEQLTGIVLVWSWWSGSQAEDWGWETFFIPKAMVQLHDGVGYDCPLSRPKSSYFGNKYVYIYDTHIKGHADNVATGTANNVPYTNNKWVLRYVFGC